MPQARQVLAQVMGGAITFLAHLVTAVRGIWDGCEPVDTQRIYFANHTSNGDFVLVWTILPRGMRLRICHLDPAVALAHFLPSAPV